MGKRLAPALAILAMLVPAAANALGLGNITMNSALNQPLDADIELLSVQSGDLANLVVRLGSDEDFQRVGAERAFFLTKIKFDVKRRADGTAYVHMTTTPVVTEPFLDFVVEARWSRGRILREFTVLVDPPVLSAEAPAAVQQPSVAAQPAPAAAPAPTQAATRQAPIRARAELAPVAHGAGELTYGPVQRNDTLYEIANRMRPSGVTVNQMMLALVRNNPNAFYNGNVNQLKAGYVLRVEDAAALSELSVAQADAEVSRQRNEWQARKSGKLVRQAEAPTGGRIARGGEGAGAAAGSAADQARLKLVAPGSKGAGSGAGEENVEQLRQDLLLAAEALDANRQETEELKSRLAEMEEQLTAMQRLITLKDDEMLAMQKQMGGAAAELEKAAEPAMPEAVEKEAAAKAEMPEAGTEAEKMAGEAATPAPAAEAPKAAPKPAPKPAMEEPGLLDDPMVLYGGIGILVLIVAAVVIQRRRRLQGGFEESILNVGGEGGNVGATAETMAQGGESSMVSDFAMSEMSGMSGIEADSAEVDPVSEADVYLAYGRHQQAEDILKEALEKEPQRHEIKLKLLEVYFAAKDREAFEQHAQELHDSLGDESDPLWAKTVTMGSQLCPGSELFGGTSTEALKENLEEGASAGDEDLLDFDFDIEAEGLGGESGSGAGEEMDNVFAELEAATSGEASAAEAVAAESTLAEEESDMGLDFDMDLGGESAEVTTEAAPTEEVAKASDDNSLDFDVSSLDFSLDEGDVDAATVATAESEVAGLDFDLEGLGGGEEAATMELDAELEAPVEEFTAESEALLAEAGEDEGEVLDLGDELDDTFGDVDEVGTKLDLAKAYVDMGDSDGARSILDEVMEEGDEEQKKQAEELIAQLA
jgi:pilus assembly protein FimV